MVSANTLNMPDLDLDEANGKLANADAQVIVQWAVEHFGMGLVLSSSFGVQSAVMLHLVSRVKANIPVIFIDTGFLFPETYRFAEQMIERLKLNVKVYQSPISPARMVAMHGELWGQDRQGQDRYHQIRKVEPMQRALDELNVTAWISGLRNDQTEYRQTLHVVDKQDGRYKILPILNWSKQDVQAYLTQHDLPYHPLRDKGYEWIGDWHSSRPITGEDTHERLTRFRGLKQECGLHLPMTEQENQSRDSSGL